MRMTGCVLDVFSGISKLALAARTPFIYVDDRARYVSLKEVELDDIGNCLVVPFHAQHTDTAHFGVER